MLWPEDVGGQRQVGVQRERAHRGRGGGQGLSLRCVRFEMAVVYPRGHDESEVRQMALEF